jgi:hypothetical protein
MEEEVRMALDHPGHEGRAGQFDDASACWRSDIGTGRNDAVAVDEHRPAFVGLRVHSIEHTRGLQQDRLRERGRSEGERQQEQDQLAHQVETVTAGQAKASAANH